MFGHDPGDIAFSDKQDQTRSNKSNKSYKSNKSNKSNNDRIININPNSQCQIITNNHYQIIIK